MRVVFVHGACVKDGPWWWHRTGELLAERGIASEAPALPSCGETGEPAGAGGPGLTEDVAAVRQVLTASDEPTVVVAHSYGGIITAEAAAGVGTVRHLLFVSSYLPEVGQSLSSFGDGEPAPFLDIDPEGGTFTVRPDALAETFLQDCDPEIQLQATDKTARQSLHVLAQPVKSAAWQHVPSTYLVCAQDEAPPPGCNASAPAGRPASWSSTPATTRSSPSRPPYATWSSGCSARNGFRTPAKDSWLIGSDNRVPTKGEDMNRLLVGVVCALTGGIIATSAIGQGTGGTVGPAAVGTKTFEVRVKESDIGFNCVASKPRKCLRLRPRIANIFAGNGAVYDGSTRVGTAGFATIAAKVKRAVARRVHGDHPVHEQGRLDHRHGTVI